MRNNNTEIDNSNIYTNYIIVILFYSYSSHILNTETTTTTTATSGSAGHSFSSQIRSL